MRYLINFLRLEVCLYVISSLFILNLSAIAQTFNGTTSSTFTASSGTTASGALPVTVPDSTGGCGGAIAATTTSFSCITIPVSGRTTSIGNITASFTVGSDPSTWIGDYGFVLRAPGGSPSITLMGQPGNATPFAGGCGDSTNINAGTAVTFADSGGNLPTTVAGLASTATLPTGAYQPSLGTTSPNGSMNTTFSGMSAAAQNGNWELCFYDVSGTDTMSVSAVNINLSSPTAGDGSISGRVVNLNGKGISRTRIFLTDTNTGETYTINTNPFGYFRINDLAVGNFYIMSTFRKGYTFDVQSFTLLGNLSDLQIVGY